MRKLISFLVGIGLGVAAGMALVTLFSPVSGREVRQNLRDHYRQSMQAARDAAAKKRGELQAELERLASDTDEA